jgi:hypothetical protein
MNDSLISVGTGVLIDFWKVFRLMSLKNLIESKTELQQEKEQKTEEVDVIGIYIERYSINHMREN